MRIARLIALFGIALAAKAAEPVKIVLSAEHPTYAVSDQATIQVALLNLSKERITVYGILQWGYAAGFVLHVFDDQGKEVMLPRYDDYIPIPSLLDRAESYVTLEPDHLLGALRTDKLADWGVKPGKYRIWVEYRSPVPRKYRQDSTFWSREDGVLRSNSIDLNILP